MRFSKTVEAFFEWYPEEINIEIYAPGLSRKLDEAGIKWDYMEFERKYVKEKMRQWMEQHPEFNNIIVPEEYFERK